MKTDKYTIMFIPDDESKSRSIHVSRNIIKSAIWIGGILFLVFSASLYIYFTQLT